MSNSNSNSNPGDQSAQRRAKLAALREQGNPYPNDFRRSHWTSELHAEYAERDAESLEAEAIQVAIVGRMMSRRIMGKASFAHIQDGSGRLQLYVRRDDVEASAVFGALSAEEQKRIRAALDRYDGIGVRIEDDVLITTADPEVLSEGIPRTVEEIEAFFAEDL